MTKRDNLDSDFGGCVNFPSNNTVNNFRGIDFNSATKLRGGGSTCEIYRTRIKGRLVFIKRLKEKYRGNPLYMAAFQKEYEIAISLNHQCLPYYHDCTDEYITMSYVDGQTLAAMIKKQDKWLTDKENVKKVLRSLLDVLSYLHDRNVIHCDVKADNVMLCYGTHNLFLIDLDKCYTSWFDNTAGASEKYDLPEESRKTPLMDFRGIGKIIDNLTNKLPGFPAEYFLKFREECRSKYVTADRLLKILDEEENKEKKTTQSMPETAIAQKKKKTNHFKDIGTGFLRYWGRIKYRMDRKNITEMIEDIFKMTGILVISACILAVIFAMCSDLEENQSGQTVDSVEVVGSPKNIVK